MALVPEMPHNSMDYVQCLVLGGLALGQAYSMFERTFLPKVIVVSFLSFFFAFLLALLAFHDVHFFFT